MIHQLLSHDAMSGHLFAPIFAARNFRQVYYHTKFCYPILNRSLICKFRPAIILAIPLVTDEKCVLMRRRSVA
jgi:hypothetical protein